MNSEEWQGNNRADVMICVGHVCLMNQGGQSSCYQTYAVKIASNVVPLRNGMSLSMAAGSACEGRMKSNFYKSNCRFYNKGCKFARAIVSEC